MKSIIKNIFALALFFTGQLIFAQVIIGGETGGATDKTSVLLEFANTNDKGIILPYTTGEITAADSGTFIFDAVVAKVKFKKDTGWLDLSNNIGVVDASIQTGLTDTDLERKVVIGADSSTANGVLVLEHPNKAMVLPIVTSTDVIINPSAGMIVFVDGDNKVLATFNGSKWSYFAAND